MHTSPNCTAAVLESIATSKQGSYIFLEIFGVLMCVFSVPLTYYSCECFEKERVQMHLKILMYFHHIALIMYSLSYISLGTYHLLSRLVFDGCDLLVPIDICIWVRIFQSFSSIFFQLFYIAVVLNTFMAKFQFWRSNENFVRGVAYFCAFFSIFEPLPSVYKDIQRDGHQLNCSSFEHKDALVQKNIFIGFLTLDFGSAIGFCIAMILQKRDMKDPVLKFNITKKHREMELHRTLILIFPNLILNMFCYVYFAGISMRWAAENQLDGNAFLVANSVPVYVFFSPIMWMITLRRWKGRVNPAPIEPDDYWKILTDTWNQVFNSKNDSGGLVVANGRRKRNQSENAFYSITDTEHVELSSGN
ncbi:G protein-coupled receptor [Caenorhabditis elegans]|uniref:G protein-coupled receptor n=1 Tax=Caenorhabditis elegans TaxID=6239 RepID=Q9NAM8_CAEEL|nr:G protein-coupled receptor [Caenorhabditis elegans]CAB54354.3 G protein-coupled receptor [Caenorhabditis elegans]|eukprot:NP_502897.3 Uncharacterized protein CELE_Y105C5B.8 [Caenorhabditis elegans]